MLETIFKLKQHQNEDHFGRPVKLPVKRIHRYEQINQPQKTVKNRYGPPMQIMHTPAGFNMQPARFDKSSEIKLPPTAVNEPLTVRAKSIHFSKKITMVLSEKIPCHLCKENTVIRNYSNHLFERHNAKGGIY